MHNSANINPIDDVVLNLCINCGEDSKDKVARFCGMECRKAYFMRKNGNVHFKPYEGQPGCFVVGLIRTGHYLPFFVTKVIEGEIFNLRDIDNNHGTEEVYDAQGNRIYDYDICVLAECKSEAETNTRRIVITDLFRRGGITIWQYDRDEVGSTLNPTTKDEEETHSTIKEITPEEARKIRQQREGK